MTTIVRTGDQVIADIRARLESLYNETEDTIFKSEVEATWNDVAQIGAMLTHLQDQLSAQATKTEAMQQERDLALHELRAARSRWVRWATKVALRNLAYSIAQENRVDERDVYRALAHLIGDREQSHASMYAESNVAEALAALGRELVI